MLIALHGGTYLLPDASDTRSLPKALGAWLDAARPPRGGARPGAGRKPGTGREGVRRTLLLSHAAIAVLEAVPERQRGAWVSAAIEAAATKAVK